MLLSWSLLLLACTSDHTLVLSPTQVQAKVDEKFPLQRGMSSVFSLTLSEPQVSFPGDRRLATRLAVAAEWPDLSSVTPTAAQVPPEADAAAHAQDLLRRLTDAAAQVAASPRRTSRGTVTTSGELTYAPEEGAFYLIHTQLDALDLADLPPEHVESARTLGTQAVSAVLDRLPVYTLDDDLKGKAARLVLKDIHAEPDGLHVTLGR